VVVVRERTRTNGGWKLLLLAVLMVGLPSVLAVGATPGTADAASTAPTGYYTFGPQAFGDASNCSTPAVGDFTDAFANQPVVGMAITPNCSGGWVATSDGGVFSSAGTPFYGSAGDLDLNAPVVGIVATPDGNGYWLTAADGGIFNYGDAGFYGSAGNLHLDQPVVAMAVTPDGDGYWMVATDGGVFTFGDAGFFGSLAEYALGPGGSEGSDLIANPVIGITPSPTGQGYFLLSTTPAVNPHVPGDTGYELAKREWQATQYEASYIQGATWVQAADYLTMGERVDPGPTSGYPAAVQQLLQLASIPETDVSPAEDAEGNADIAGLNAFFTTSD
jgi:hypothetical protein